MGLRSTAMLILVAHVPLALAMQRSAEVTVFHALLTVVVGIRYAWAADMQRSAYMAAYITGAEVLWRMTNGLLFWELGKYTAIAVLVIALIQRKTLRLPTPPAIYVAALLPSAALTLAALEFGEARRQISFNLSGPLALGVAAWFFSHVRLTGGELLRLFLALITPIVGVGVIVLYGILTNPDITFTTESNSALSGGFGPNQVSAMLGLGALLALWAALEGPATRTFRLVMLAAVVALTAQSAMTFSRGGIYAAAGASVPLLLCTLRDPRARYRLITAAAVIVATAYILFPRLDEFTGGTLSARFQETELTHRDEISEGELQVWHEEMLFGVGPGQVRMRHGIAAHTEFTRVLAEHGLLGCVGLAALAVGAVLQIRRARTIHEKAAIAAVVAWSTLFMLSAAMRLLAPSFMFGLAFAHLHLHMEAPVEAAPQPKPETWRVRPSPPRRAFAGGEL